MDVCLELLTIHAYFNVKFNKEFYKAKYEMLHRLRKRVMNLAGAS